jgi:hypothetical protein
MGRDMESRYGRRICDGDMRWGYGEKGYGKVMICEKKAPATFWIAGADLGLIVVSIFDRPCTPIA